MICGKTWLMILKQAFDRIQTLDQMVSMALIWHFSVHGDFRWPRSSFCHFNSHLSKVTLWAGTPVTKACYMYFPSTSQPWIPKMFQGTPAEIERGFWWWYQNFSSAVNWKWVKKSLYWEYIGIENILYLMVTNKPEHSLITGYGKTYS